MLSESLLVIGLLVQLFALWAVIGIPDKPSVCLTKQMSKGALYAWYVAGLGFVITSIGSVSLPEARFAFILPGFLVLLVLSVFAPLLLVWGAVRMRPPPDDRGGYLAWKLKVKASTLAILYGTAVPMAWSLSVLVSRVSEDHWVPNFFGLVFSSFVFAWGSLVALLLFLEKLGLMDYFYLPDRPDFRRSLIRDTEMRRHDTQ